MMMTHAEGLNWERVDVTFADWPALKPKTPGGSMPVIQMPHGAMLGQTCSLARLMGRFAGYHPTDPKQAA